MLVCPVRGCRKPLTREPRRAVCPAGHCFDLARSGYLNLLQPQDRRSKDPGDTAAAIAGRRRIHDLGVTRPLLDAIAQAAHPGPDDIALDAGCGEGFYVGNLRRLAGCAAHGADISVPAVEAAARRYPDCTWIVANADRQLPYADGSFTLLLSITGRLNEPEFHRLLRPEGRLVVATPGPGDLAELRGASAGRDRQERTVALFEPGFRLERRQPVSATAELDAEAIAALRHAIYRPGMGEETARRVTFALDVLEFRRR